MIHLGGATQSRFAPVREAFAENLRLGEDLGAGFAVVRDGETLVDLWGGYADVARTREWQADTLVNIWSVTKGVVALAVALLVDRGKLAYDDAVAKHWPEFAAEGKGAIGVGVMLSHQAGLAGLRQPTTIEDFYAWDPIVAGLAAQAPLWPPGTAAGYHSLTFGHLAGELIRRIDGRSPAAFLREELARPLGADFHLGLAASEEPRVAEILPLVADPLPALPAIGWYANNPPLDPAWPNARTWRAAVVPGANGHATALALARLFGALGRPRPLLGTAALADLSRERFDGMDLVLQDRSRLGAGVFLNQDGAYGPNPDAFGHGGWGGSCAFYDPIKRVGVGYVMNWMRPEPPPQPRRRRLIDALYAALS
ncbi:MAG: class A beta-lactamase-related serine hydrolase [Alphaproteobacteria bacterium]|nr:class A beta-lactamase-related serine hydrolase [Alphaproteobacteria bacterium]